MFTTDDMLSLDYFSVLDSNERGDWELRSNNTGHYWKLIRNNASYFLYHKHHIEDKYHYQTAIGNIFDFVLYVVEHDEYQIRGRKNISRSKEKQQGSYFFTLIDTYGLKGEKA